MAVSPAPLAGGGAFIAGAPALTPFRRNGAGHPPPPHLRPGSLWMAGGIPAHHPPPVPSLQYCDWRLRDSSPGMASASMGSISLCLLLTSSSFCPSSFFWESLGRSPFPGRPFCPFHPGLPRCPGFGATGGRRFPPSLFGRGMMELSLHHPSGGSSRRTKGGPEVLPPSSGRPRRGGAAPAFVGTSNSSLSAPRVLALGTGKPQPPVLAARSPMRLPVWTASVEKRNNSDLIVVIHSLYIT